MRQINNWDEVRKTADEVVTFANIPAGPQICKIVKVEDLEAKEYLKVFFDIAEGDFKGAFKESEERFGEWPQQGITYRSYKEAAESFWIAFWVAIEKSNPNYKADFVANSLIGKYFVANFGEEEYLSEDEFDENGFPLVKVSMKCQEVRSLIALKEDKIKIMNKKVLKQNNPQPKETKESKSKANNNSIPNQQTPVLPDDDDLPF